MASTSETEWTAVDRARNADRLVAGLDRLREDEFFARSKARIDALLPRHGESWIVDVGCGTGEDAVAAQRRNQLAIGVERSVRMLDHARRRYPTLASVAADGRSLPLADASVDVVIADRLLQHLVDAEDALLEFRRVLRHGGLAISFDPDLTTAEVEGVDGRLAAAVLGWRRDTRPGAGVVRAIERALISVGFGDVHLERRLLDLESLDRADGIMGLAGWGTLAAAAGRLSDDAARRWSGEVHDANEAGTLRYRCEYVLVVGRVLP